MPADAPMVLVPREPTEAMLEAAAEFYPRSHPSVFPAIYRVMLSASPVRDGEPTTTSTADQVGAEAGLVEAGHVVWWKEGGVNYFPQGEGFSVSRSCRVEPLVTRESALAAIAAARAAPSPGEGDARLCPCGKPSLPTASVCPDCADACLASGEGEAPFTADDLAQEIRRVDGNNSLGAGALAEALMPFLSRPTPATPEGLREKVVTAIWDWTRSTTLHLGDIDKVRALADAILSALQPQAQETDQ